MCMMRTMQRDDSIPERLAHTPDLTVASFRQDDPKSAGPGRVVVQGTCACTQNDRPRPRVRNVSSNSLIHFDSIFPFMPMLDP